MRTKEELKKELRCIDLEIAELLCSSDRENRYNELSRKSRALREEIRFMDYKLIATDYEIDIYEVPVERYVKYYWITPHNLFEEIGFVKICYGAAAKQRMGNIGYEIKEAYRGKGYAYRALEMLVDEMLSRNLDAPTLAAFPSNIPSVHTIEKFGGEKIYQAKNRFDWNIYQVDLKSKKENKILSK